MPVPRLFVKWRKPWCNERIRILLTYTQDQIYPLLSDSLSLFAHMECPIQISFSAEGKKKRKYNGMEIIIGFQCWNKRELDAFFESFFSNL